MSLISTSTMSNFSIPKAMLDTTVLCGALLSPGGINRRLLEFARVSVFYTPVLSNVCMLEFLRNAITGLGKKGGNKRVFSYEEIETFLDVNVYPILDKYPVINSAYSRNSYEIVKECTTTAKIGDVLTKLTELDDTTAEAMALGNLQIGKNDDMEQPLHKFDLQDFHVWATAIGTRCDYIVTSNTRRFPENIGTIKRISPLDFYNFFAV
jgi:hypothetical protein